MHTIQLQHTTDEEAAASKLLVFYCIFYCIPNYYYLPSTLTYLEYVDTLDDVDTDDEVEIELDVEALKMKENKPR